MRRTAAVLLALTACTESTPTPVKQPPKPVAIASPAPPSEGDGGAATVTATVVPVGKPGWKSVPQEQNGFWLALDGLCAQLAMARVGSDVVISYGGGREHIYQGEKDRVGGASFLGLRANRFEAVGDPPVRTPDGIAGTSLEDFWVNDNGGMRGSAAPTVRHRKNGVWKEYPGDNVQIEAWVDGGVIGTRGFTMMSGHDLWVEGSTTVPPLAFWDGYWGPGLTAFPSGDVFLFVNNPGQPMFTGPLFVRHWSPTSKVTQTNLSMLASKGAPDLVVGTAPDEVYAGVGEKIAMYDGATWKLLGSTTKKEKTVGAKRVAKGELWVQVSSGNLEKSTPAGFVPVATPERIVSFDGASAGAMWAIGASGKLYKQSGEAWTEMKVPLPAFSNGPAPIKLRRVLVLAPDDVILRGDYWEKGLGWTEQELHHVLFRSKKQDETLRCNEPDPENNNINIGHGFQSWPPFATASCTTPFVVITRRSRQKSRAPKEWDKITAALKDHKDLVPDGKLIEITSGDRTFLGAKAKDFESAKEIALLTAAKNRIRPEVLCAEPPPALREVPLD